MMGNFGDILDAWESSSRKEKEKKPGSRNINQESKEKKTGKMQTGWLDLYPPEDKDSPQNRHSSEPGNSRRINPEKMPIQAAIDLHGLTSLEAESAVEKFLKDSSGRGYRKVLIIHGKGYHSPGGKSVLKKVIRQLLERSPLVSTFGKGDRFNGGHGASCVFLINKKKK